MRNQLSAASLVLGTGVVSSTGDSLFVNGKIANVDYINGIGSITSGNLTLTGQALLNVIAVTGQAAWVNGQNNATNLSGNLFSTGSILDEKINNTNARASNAVFTTGTQFISGTKYFLGNTFIDNLFVTGQQTIINTQDLHIADNWIVMNSTGGARDSAIFVSTGFTGAAATGGVLGFDVPSNTWRFGLASQQSDLITLPKIASGEAIDALDVRLIQSGDSLAQRDSSISGFLQSQISINLTQAQVLSRAFCGC